MNEKDSNKEIKKLPKLWEKYSSRKLFILFIATVLLFFDKIDSATWLVIALAYISMNLAQKWIQK